MKICKDCANKGKKEKCKIYTSVSNYAEKCKDFKQIELMGQNAKSISQLLQEISEDICNNYCKYQETTDDEGLCDAIRDGGRCPFDRLT